MVRQWSGKKGVINLPWTQQGLHDISLIIVAAPNFEGKKPGMARQVPTRRRSALLLD